LSLSFRFSEQNYIYIYVHVGHNLLPNP
jgi:hypothetical protein